MGLLTMAVRSRPLSIDRLQSISAADGVGIKAHKYVISRDFVHPSR
jgi:hypothetical protein